MSDVRSVTRRQKRHQRARSKPTAPVPAPKPARQRTPVPLAARLIQWGSLALALVVLVIFLLSQQQSASEQYGTDKLDSTAVDAEPSQATTGTLPTDAELKKAIAASTIVRLPGAVATLNEAVVTARIKQADVTLAAKGEPAIKVLLAPPGLSDADSRRLEHLPGSNVTVVGLAVSFDIYSVLPSTANEWQSVFGTGDVTQLILAGIAGGLDQPAPPEVPSSLRWRDPTAGELSTVVAGLRDDRHYVDPGADLSGIPKLAATAFPGTPPMVVALPQQPPGQGVPDYAPALAREFPNTPIVVMYGYWISYAGPHADGYADLAAATFYGSIRAVISDTHFPQFNLLSVYLQQWAALRFSGMFDRPLPYSPPDPIGIALPALPWIFLGCVLIFVAVSVHSVHSRRPGQQLSAPSTRGQWVRLTALSSLAIEVSPLVDGAARAPLTRGIKRLSAAKQALDTHLPAALIDSQLDAGTREFARVATAIHRQDYLPETYLAGRSS
ncbi:MAG: hypothetical protein ACR2P2_17160 [Nakamurella sp.]